MNRKRGILAGAAASVALLSLALSGCAMGGSAATGPSAAAKQEDGRTVVEYWRGKGIQYEDDWWKKTVDQYNAAQDKYQVKISIIPADTWAQKLKAAQATGTAPDMYLTGLNPITTAARQKQIKAISDYIPAEKWGTLQESILDAVTVDGKQYAFPFLVEPTSLLYYRTDLFEAAGLDPANPPTSWDELIEAGKKLTKDGIFGLQTAQDAASFAPYMYGMQYNAAGHLPISDDWSKAQADDPAYVPLLSFYQRLYQEGVLPKQAIKPYFDAAAFGEGKFAMMQGGSWSTDQLLHDYPDIVGKIAVAPFPTVDGSRDRSTASLSATAMAIDGKARNPEGAADFISWAFAGDPEIMAGFFETMIYSKFSPRSDVTALIDADPEAAKVNPWRAKIASEVVPDAIAEPNYDPEISQAFALAMEQAVQGTDPAKALADAQRKIQKIIDTKGLAGKS